MALKEKLRELRERDLSIDHGVRLKEWREVVQALLDEIEEMLAAYTSEGLMRCLRVDVRREEEALGVYDTQELHIVAADRTIVVSPVARSVIGADGRVDVYRRGRREQGYFLLWDKAAKGSPSWRIEPMRERPHAWMVVPFTKVKFETVLENLLEP